MTHLSRMSRPASWAAASLACALLVGCYVVPLQPAQPLPAPVAPAAAPAPLMLGVRLYPANDAATPYGVLAATVSNDLGGRGHFSAVIGGESFGGEATRAAGSAREGMANGAGNRGGYISCRYTMNSPTLGTGSCRLNTGAVFSMHIGS